MSSRNHWIRCETQGSVLDVGCGSSIYYWRGEEHIEQRIKYLGVDKYKDPIDIDHQLPERFVVGKAENVPVPDDEFETILLADVLEHCENPISALQEATRVGTDQILISVTDEDEWEMGIDFDVGDNLEHPKRKYTANKLISHLESAGISESAVTLDYTKDFPLAFFLAKIQL